MTAKIFSKDLRLAAHPMMYVFALFGVMLIIPNYPYTVVFFYGLLGIFFTFLNGRENKDVYYCAVLPVTKRDQVRARAHMPGITIGGLDAMREAVRYERRVEFPVEAVNFFDEVRWGTYKETKFQGQDVHGGQSWWGDNTVEYAWYWDDCLWPWSVPQGELQRNASLTTRPGCVY